MKRRFFIGLISSLCFPFEKTIMFDSRDGFMRISGEINEICKFLYKFQDCLWPDWRSNNIAMNKMNMLIGFAKRNGCLFFDCSNRLCKEAFVKALSLSYP